MILNQTSSCEAAIVQNANYVIYELICNKNNYQFQS